MLIILNLLEDVVCNDISTDRLTAAEIKMLDGKVGEVDTVVDS
jgi:hypothetical protein